MSTAIPLTTPGRLARYWAQNGGPILTPRQRRRLDHKQNRARAHGLKAATRAAKLRGEA